MFVIDFLLYQMLFRNLFLGAFASTVTEKTVFGNKRFHYGTYTNTGGSTGGSVATGLARVDGLFIQPVAAAVVANVETVNETFPVVGENVRIVTDANEIGNWFAFGV